MSFPFKPPITATVDSSGNIVITPSGGPSTPPSGASWHPAILETPLIVTVADLLAMPSSFTIPNKRALPPSIGNPIQAGPGVGVGSVPNGFFFEIDNVTVKAVNV